MPPRTPPRPLILRGHESAVTAAAVTVSASSDGDGALTTRLLTGDNQGMVVLWNQKTRRPQVRVHAHDPNMHAVGGLLSLKWIDDAHFVSHGRDGLFKKWKVEDEGEAVSMQFKKDVSSIGFCGCAVSVPTSTSANMPMIFAAPGDTEGVVHVYSVLNEDGEHQCECEVTQVLGDGEGDLGLVMALKFVKLNLNPGTDTKDGILALIVAYECGALLIWNAENGVILDRIEARSKEPLLCLAVSQGQDNDNDNNNESHCDSVLVATGNAVGETSLFSLSHSISSSEADAAVMVKLTHLHTLPMSMPMPMPGNNQSESEQAPTTNTLVQSLSFAKNGRVILSGLGNGMIQANRTSHPFPPLAALRAHSDSVQCIQCADYDGGVLVVSGGKDERVCMHELWKK